MLHKGIQYCLCFSHSQLPVSDLYIPDKTGQKTELSLIVYRDGEHFPHFSVYTSIKLKTIARPAILSLYVRYVRLQ